MPASARWKYFLILAVVLLGVVHALPNAYQKILRPGHRQPHRQAGCGAGTRARRAGQGRLHPKAVAIDGAATWMARMTNLDEQNKANILLRNLLGEDHTVALNPTHRARNGCRGHGADAAGLDQKGRRALALPVDQIQSAPQKRIALRRGRAYRRCATTASGTRARSAAVGNIIVATSDVRAGGDAVDKARGDRPRGADPGRRRQRRPRVVVTIPDAEAAQDRR